MPLWNLNGDIKSITLYPEDGSHLFLALDNQLLLSWLKSFFILCLVLFGVYWCFTFMLYQLALFFKKIPRISKIEKTALNVGDIGIEQDFLRGKINKKRLLSQKFPVFSQKEQDFLNTQVENLCDISSEWDFLNTKKLSSQEEEFLKKERFLGLTLSEKYEGLGFSALAHAKVIEKIASHNIPLSILTMVPNSIGPAELLLKYGSPTQKTKYLKKLAKGEIWPCFGLTEIEAGSDASSIQSTATLFKEERELKLRVNFEKRWITLAARANLIALAVQLKDPDKLLSDETDLGITLLLIPSKAKGLKRDSYHNPMDLPIDNAPIKGIDVILPAEDSIIGGLKQAGKGWKMIVECLSAGRAISLPALATGSSKKCSFVVSTHSFIRRQFGLPICYFEGIQDSLASILGWTHLIKTTQLFTLSSLNQGVVSPVASALTKYQLTELSQKILKKSMDVMGGAALSLGPRNKIAPHYKALPLAITVEGANILTRTFITYGQGLVKLHPQVQALIQALEQKNFLKFHKNIVAFIYHFLCQFVRTGVHFLIHLILSLTAFLYFKSIALLSFITRASFFANSPYGFVKRFLFLQKLKYSSALFSFLSDLSLICLGEKLKRKGQTSGRFADWLSLQYMISSLMWYHHHKKTHPLLTRWSLDYCFLENQRVALELLQNYPQSFVRWLLTPLVGMLKIRPLSNEFFDPIGKQLVQEFFKESDLRESLWEGMYQPKDPQDQMSKLKKAFELSLKERETLKQNKKLSKEEEELLKQARLEALQVDTFSKEEYFK